MKRLTELSRANRKLIRAVHLVSEACQTTSIYSDAGLIELETLQMKVCRFKDEELVKVVAAATNPAELLLVLKDVKHMI